MHTLRLGWMAAAAAALLTMAVTAWTVVPLPGRPVAAPAIGALAPAAAAVTKGPTVKITPGSKIVMPSENPLAISIEFCSYPSSGGDVLLDYTLQIKLNNVDITSQFSHQAIMCGSGNQADDMGWISTGSLNIVGSTNQQLKVDVWGLSGNLYGDIANYSGPEPLRGVVAPADGQYADVRASTASTAKFTIRNTGAVRDTFALSMTCAGAGLSSGSCSLSPSSLALNANQTGTATVSFTSGATVGSSGLITLKASKATNPGAAADSSWTEVTVIPTPAAGVVLVGATDVTARDQCLTIALGSGMASECGDLRVVHPLPPVMTMGAARAPTLIYNSQHARIAPVVRADVTLPTGTLPSQVAARVLVNGAQRGSATFSGSQWGTGGSTRRIAVLLDSAFSTGLHNITIDIIPDGGQGYTASGTLPVVRRTASNFGAGWWFAGLEGLHQITTTSVFWVGGDGSTRRYNQVGTSSVYKAANVTRPDSIVKDGSGRFVRWGPDRSRVFFDAGGRQDSTANRLGYVTRFHYTGTRLDSISLPTPSAGAVRYRFHYSGAHVTGGVLDSVRAPGPTGGYRTTAVRRDGVRVDTIRDPDLTWVRFGYGTGADGRRIQSRTNRRGVATSIGYNAGSRVTRGSVVVGSSVLRDSIIPAETRGLPGTATPTAQPLDSIFTLLDGPRTDVADHTRFWTNALGAPYRVRNAVGRETRVWHSAQWPGLVEKSQSPDRLVTRAFYNARALTDSVRVENPLGNGQNAVTRYLWHTTYDQPTRVTSPMGVQTDFGYNGTNGNRIWEQLGTSSVRRVNFDYHATGLLAAVRVPLMGPDSVYYDGMGNLVRRRSPMGFLSLTYRDAIGRDTLTVVPIDTAGKTISNVLSNGARTRTTYYPSGRPHVAMSLGPSVSVGSVGTHPADTLRLIHEYDNEGNLTKVTRNFRRNKAPINQTPQWETLNIATQWQYDNANRLTAHAPSGSSFESYTLDGAGNVTAVTTRRGHVITSTYDAANQLTRRIVPQVNYGETWCWTYGGTGCLGLRFPTLDSKPGVCLPADTAYFGHDHTGRLVQADNMYARVRRTYTRNGLPASETQRVRTYYRSATLNPCGEEAPAPMWPVPTLERDFNEHVYTVTRTYDRDGRRLTLGHPAAGGTQSYAYHTAGSGGLLASTTDPLGRPVSFSYDNAHRRWRTTYPGAVTVDLTFDGDGRIATQTGASLAATLVRDARGRVFSGSVTPATGGGAFDVRLWYNGLGAVVAGQGLTYAASYEEMRADATGGRTWQRVQNALPNYSDRRRHSHYLGEQLTLVAVDSVSGPKPFPAYNYRQEYFHEPSGNVHRTWGFENQVCGTEVCRIDDEAVSYYGADDKLRIYNRHVGLGTGSQPGGVYEEYRYDALGRRVMTRSRSTASCTSTECNSYIERVAWDGDNVVMEVRGRGKQGATPSQLISDLYTGNAVDNWILGRVRYIHGPGIDAPVLIRRQQMQSQPDSLTVAPHANWQGDLEVGTLMNGTLTTTCNGASGCPVIAWPGHNATADGESTLAGTPGWFGSLIANRTDGSGLQYMRNRYYDPKTGRFVQEDPIGLAGGMNLYGFAGGDPINFSDPFGLCPIPADSCPVGTFTAIGMMTGAILGGIGGGGIGSLGGPAAVVTVPALSVAGASKGAAIGGIIGGALDASIVLSKGESAQIGAAIESVMGKAHNTEQARRDVGDYCEDCKGRGIRGTKNDRGDFTFRELKERVREFFGRD